MLQAHTYIYIYCVYIYIHVQMRVFVHLQKTYIYTYVNVSMYLYVYTVYTYLYIHTILYTYFSLSSTVGVQWDFCRVSVLSNASNFMPLWKQGRCLHNACFHTWCFVLLGTTYDKSVLWQHVPSSFCGWLLEVWNQFELQWFWDWKMTTLENGNNSLPATGVSWTQAKQVP